MAVTGFPAFHSHSHAIESLSSPNFTGAVVGHAPKSLVPDPYVRAVHPIPAGKLLKNFSVTTSNLPALSQKHGELLKDEGQYKLLLQKKTLTDGEVYNLQCLAFNIHRVYGLGMYDCSSLAVVPSDLQKSVDVVLRAIRRIEEDPRISNDRIFPQLRYSLAKMMMMCAQQLPEGCEEAGSLREAAMVHYQSSNTFSGSAFALLVEAFSGDLTKPDILKQFRDRVAALHFSKEEQSYYAGKYFKGLAAASEGNKGLQKTYRGLSAKYFKAARGSGFYWGEKANAYMAQEFMSEAREMYTGAGSLAPGSEGFLEKVLGKIREAFQLIFGSGIGNVFESGNQVYVTPNKKLGADSYAVLADGCALAYAIIEGPDPDIKKDALRYQEAANALGKPSHWLQVDQEYHLDLIAKATPELLDAMARMQYESPEINTALVKRAAANIPQSKEVLLLLIGQGKVHLEEIAAVDNLPPDVMIALLPAAATAGTLAAVCQKLIGKGRPEILLEIAAIGALPPDVVSALLQAARTASIFESVYARLIDRENLEILLEVADSDSLPEGAPPALLAKIASLPGGRERVLTVKKTESPGFWDKVSNLGETEYPILLEVQKDARAQMGKKFLEKQGIDLNRAGTWGEGRSGLELAALLRRFDEFSPDELQNAIRYAAENGRDTTAMTPEAREENVKRQERELIGVLLDDDQFLQYIVCDGSDQIRDSSAIISNIEKVQGIFITQNLVEVLYDSWNSPYRCNIRTFIGARVLKRCQFSTEIPKELSVLAEISDRLGLGVGDLLAEPDWQARVAANRTWYTALRNTVSFLQDHQEYRTLSTALFAAVREGNQEVSCFLVAIGRNTGLGFQMAEDQEGWTLFHCAVASGNVAIFVALVDVIGKNPEMFETAADRNKGPFPAVPAVPAVPGSAAVLHSYMHICDKGGSTPLHHAVLTENIQMVECIINTATKDNPLRCCFDKPKLDGGFGNTALHYAAQAGNYQIIQYLVGGMRCGTVSMSIKDVWGDGERYGETALCCAVKGGHAKAVACLVQAIAGFHPNSDFDDSDAFFALAVQENPAVLHAFFRQHRQLHNIS